MFHQQQKLLYFTYVIVRVHVHTKTCINVS